MPTDTDRRRTPYASAAMNLAIDGQLLLLMLTHPPTRDANEDVYRIACAVGHWGLTLLDNPPEAS
jgi:hypothetical protein